MTELQRPNGFSFPVKKSIPKKPSVLAIDVGTSSLKVGLVNLNGEIVAGPLYQFYSIQSSEPMAATLNADVLLKSVLIACRKTLSQNVSGEIVAASLSVFMHSFMALDKKGRVLTDLLTWGDMRSYREAESISKRLDANAVRERTGCELHPIYFPSRILWLKNRLGKKWKQVAWICSFKEYLLYRFFGVRVCDYGTASSSGLLNHKERQWDRPMMDLLNIPFSLLSEPVDASMPLPRLKPQFSSVFNDQHFPWFPGSTDGPCASLGAGCFLNDRACLSLGTTAAVRVITDRPFYPPPKGLWNYLLDKDFSVVGGSLNSGGVTLSWLNRILRIKWKGALLRNPHFDRRSLNRDLIVLPFILGERSLGWNPKIQGTIYGLDFTTESEHIVRAAIEAVGYQIRDVLLLMRKTFPNIKKIVFSGGGLRVNGFHRIITDILEVPVSVFKGEASLLGAALIAFKAARRLNEYKFLNRQEDPSFRFRKLRPEESSYYHRGYQRFKKLYEVITKGLELN